MAGVSAQSDPGTLEEIGCIPFLLGRVPMPLWTKNKSIPLFVCMHITCGVGACKVKEREAKKTKYGEHSIDVS